MRWRYCQTPAWEGNSLTFELDTPTPADRENPLQSKTIVIDPGHGGEGYGAPGPGHLYEKDVVLDMSLYNCFCDERPALLFR